MANKKCKASQKDFICRTREYISGFKFYTEVAIGLATILGGTALVGGRVTDYYNKAFQKSPVKQEAVKEKEPEEYKRLNDLIERLENLERKFEEKEQVAYSTCTFQNYASTQSYQQSSSTQTCESKAAEKSKWEKAGEKLQKFAEYSKFGYEKKPDGNTEWGFKVEMPLDKFCKLVGIYK
jgi:hypothetical protein